MKALKNIDNIHIVLAVIAVILFVFLPDPDPNHNVKSRGKMEIIKQTTDERGMTSIIYKDVNGKERAADYLTPMELKELIKN